MVESLRNHFTNPERLGDVLVSEDFRPAIMGESGADVKLSPLAEKCFPFDVECKNQEKWNIPEWWKQTVGNTKKGRKPLLVVKRNYQEPLVVLRFEDFLDMLD